MSRWTATCGYCGRALRMAPGNDEKCWCFLQNHEKRVEQDMARSDAAAQRRRDERECAPPEGAILPPFLVGDAFVAPSPPVRDANGGYPVVLINGLRYCLGEDTAGNAVAGLDEDPDKADGPHSAFAMQWLDFEWRVRIKEPDALAAYGLIRAALVLTRRGAQERAMRALAAADDAMHALMTTAAAVGREGRR